MMEDELISSSETQLEIPSRLICPITGELMEDPVMLVQSGNVYERSAIQEWLTKQKIDYVDSTQITNEDLAPVNPIRSECMEFKEKMEKLKTEESQSPLVTKAIEVDTAENLLKEKQRELKILENQVKLIEDDLKEAGKEFQQNYKNFVGVCIQLKNANTELEKVCIGGLLTTTADVIRDKMDAYEKAHQEIVEEGSKVKRWVQNLLAIKDKQEQQKNILNPVKTEEKKLKEEYDKKHKELAKLNGDKQKNVDNPKSQKSKKNSKKDPKKERENKQQNPDVDRDRQSSSSSNAYQKGKNFQPKQNKGHQSQTQRNEGYNSRQKSQGNQQRQIQQPPPSPEIIREHRPPPPPPPSIQQLDELDLQGLMHRISSGDVINANVLINEDCESVVCHVHKPLFIKGLNVTKIKTNKGKQSQMNLVFKGKENITIRNSYFTRVGLVFDGINHKSGQVVQIEDSDFMSAPGNGLSFSECSNARINKSSIVNSLGNACSFQNSNGRMSRCTLQNYHLYGVQLSNSTVHYDDIQFNKNRDKQVDEGFRGEWIQMQPSNI